MPPSCFFNIIIELADLEKSYKPLPKYPAILRDIALVVDEILAVEIYLKSSGKPEARFSERPVSLIYTEVLR